MPKIWCYIQEIQTVKILSQNEFAVSFPNMCLPSVKRLILKRGKHFQVSYDAFRLLFLPPPPPPALS